MSVFLSKTPSYPYQPLDTVELYGDIDIGSITTLDSVETPPEIIYLVCIGEFYEKLELLIENEMGNGASLYISDVDIMGTPIDWGKQIFFTNIDSTTAPFIKAITYKWTVINNVYFVRNVHPTAKINIYKTVIGEG